jgi:hypothetical protein
VYRAKVIDQLDKQMMRGWSGDQQARGANPDHRGWDEPQSQSAGYVGKKMAAQAAASAAAQAGGKFAPRPAPKLAAVGGQARAPEEPGS